MTTTVNLVMSISKILITDKNKMGISESKIVEPCQTSVRELFPKIVNGWKSLAISYHRWDKVFKSGLSKFCGGQPLKNLKGYGLLSIFLKAVFHKIYLVHS